MGRDYLLADHAERKEIWHMLEMLSPRRRVAFLKECCTMVSEEVVGVCVTGSTGTVQDIFGDVSLLAFQYGLDLEKVAVRLGAYLKTKA